MKRSSILLIVALGGLLVVAALWYVSGRDGDAMDLVELFPEAEKRTSLESLSIAFDVLDVTLAGERKRAIFAHANSRIIWRVRIPPHSELQTALGLRDYTWEQPGDGVQFRVGVSDGKVYVDLQKLVLNPSGHPEDRRWVPVVADLEKWGDQDVEVIFNTEFGPSGNSANDAAVWGEPRIVPKK